MLLLVDRLECTTLEWRAGRLRQPPYVAAGIGPSHPLPGWRKGAGVWPLRILGQHLTVRVFPAGFPHLTHCHCPSLDE
jgi:hypothetical protein